MVEMVKVLLAKKETTYGTDSVPTVAANAILTRNFSSKPVEADRLARNLDNGTWGSDPTATTNQRQTHSFEVELAGSGTAGTAAPWQELLEACGMAPAVLSAGVDAQQRFALPTAAQGSLSMYHSIGTELRKALGARGTFSIDFTAGAYAFATLTTTGLLPAASPFSTGALTGAVLTRWKPPLEVNTANTTITLDGYAAFVRSLRLDAGVQANVRNLVGSRYINRGPHAMVGQLVIEAPALASKDYLSTLRNDTLVALALTHGTVAGNIVQISCPKVQITDITESEEDGKLMWTMAIAVTVDAGADDFTITAK